MMLSFKKIEYNIIRCGKVVYIITVEPLIKDPQNSLSKKTCPKMIDSHFSTSEKRTASQHWTK